MKVILERQTKETQIALALDMSSSEAPSIATGVPFFDHMLTAMSFHGGFFLEVRGKGDLDVDPHHLVEDVGLVLGDALKKHAEAAGALVRYGFSVIPMDEALSEVVIDVCNRPTCVYRADLPQPRAGNFDLSLVREFLIALANRASVALHAHCRYGENAHHMVEALFKALGKALRQAYQPSSGLVPSTKGTL
ncbi:MAG: imidazoleglycerol-phosphate dehydratase HisB [Spirochaetales bacterium]|nr:imidazoleglycerol-phosphate dehydratase HisB [Spirochaetales bacterium]